LGYVVRFFATGFYSGYSPVAPGTAGSAVGLIIFFLLEKTPPLVYLSLVLLLFGAGVIVSHYAERDFGEEDCRHIVIDEIVGILIALFLLPMGIFWVVGGFFLFRLLDILKPPPAGWIDRHVAGGWGIMGDDVVAALYTNGILHGIAWGLGL
jgi:phosphatidylglycerophosphatase A